MQIIRNIIALVFRDNGAPSDALESVVRVELAQKLLQERPELRPATSKAS